MRVVVRRALWVVLCAEVFATHKPAATTVPGVIGVCRIIGGSVSLCGIR